MAFYKCCILLFGLLFVLGAEAKGFRPDGKNCKKFVITKDSVTRVKDSNGEPARILKVILLSEISYKTCIEWYSYFFRGSTFTVSRGCKGVFLVCYEERPTSPVPLTTEPPTKPGCVRITLRSRANRPDTKDIVDNNGQPAHIISMDLFQQLDDSLVDCVEWRTFFFFGSRATAKKGCRGVFEVCYKIEVQPTTLPLTTSAPGCRIVRLLSRLNRQATVTIPAADGEIGSVSLVRQLSTRVDCVLDETFGSRGRRVFAKDGCRGVFQVCLESQLTTAPPTGDKECRKIVVTKDTRQNIEDSNGNPASITKVELIKEFSFHVCHEGFNYFFKGSTFFVNKGCKGVFKVCFVVELPLTIAPTVDPGCVRVTLSSRLNKPDRKEVTDANGNPAKIISMTVEEQISDVKCVEWFNFFFFGSSGIAKKGCKAVFKVCYKVKVTEAPLTTAPPVNPGCRVVRLLSRLNRVDRETIPASDGRVSSVTLRKQFTDVDCVQGSTFGNNGNVVFARKGCRGEFEVCLESALTTTGPVKPGCKFIKLIGKGKRPVTHKIGGGGRGFHFQIIKMDLVQDLGGAPCREWKSYYFTFDAVHVKDGCKGIFKVCFKP